MSTALLRTLLDRTTISPELPLLVRRDAFGVPVSISHSRFIREVRSFADFFGLLGLERGGIIGVVAWQMTGWLAADCAAMGLGAACVCINPESPVSVLVESLSFCRPGIVLVEDESVLNRLLAMATRLSDIRQIIVLDPEFSAPTGKSISGWQIHGLADCYSSENFALENLPDNEPSDCAMIILTPGNDGEQRAVMWTHAAVANQTRLLLKTFDFAPSAPILQSLPPTDPYFRLLVYAGLMAGWCQTLDHGTDPIALVQKHHPRGLFAPETDWEKIAAALGRQNRGLSAIARNLFRIEAGLAAGSSPLRIVLHGLRKAFELIFIRSGRVALLGQLEIGTCRGDILSLAAREILAAAGLGLLNIAMSAECGIVATGSIRFPVDALNIFPETEIEIRDSGGIALTGVERGQLYVKGPNLMKGYLRQPLKSREAIDRSGWLQTGLSAQRGLSGRLIVHGLMRDILRLSDGGFVGRRDLSSLLRLSEYIEEVAVGAQADGHLQIDVRILCGAIRRRLPKLPSELKDEELAALPKVRWLINHEIQQLLAQAGFGKIFTPDCLVIGISKS